MKEDRLYLVHIAECIREIAEYVQGDRSRLLYSSMVQDAVSRRLQVLAQSALRLSEDRRAAHPEVDWNGIRGFRNILVHDYLEVDLDMVWRVVERDLPVLDRAVQEMLTDLEEQ